MAPVIRWRDGTREGALTLTGEVITIGCHDLCEIRVESPVVPRRAARILRRDTGYLIEDLGGPNGTFVNGQRVTSHMLADGDHIRYSDVHLWFCDAEHEA